MTVSNNKTASSVGSRSSKSNEPFRYRLYYRLMDMALVACTLAVILVIVGEALGLEPEQLPPVMFYGLPLIFWPVWYILLPLLIVLAPMRDEYAELLWKRSIAQLVIITAVLPPLIYGVIWFISVFILQGDVANWNGYRPDWLLDPIINEEWRLGTMLKFWQVFTFFFVILVQFNRWRDSRAASE